MSDVLSPPPRPAAPQVWAAARRGGVALVIQEYQVGGAERQAEMIAALLVQQLGTCDVITTRREADTYAPGVRIHRVGAARRRGLWRPRNFLAAFGHFVRHGHRYAIVQGYCLSSLVLGALLGSRLRGCRTVLRVCTIGPTGDAGKIQRRPFGRLLWRLFLHADVFVALTPKMAAELRRIGVPPAKVVLLPSAVAACEADALAPRARALARAALQLPERPTVLFVGRWVEQKRLHVLLQAWRLLAPTQAVLVLAGDGPERTRVTAWMQQSGCADSVRLFGWQARPEQLYRAADIFVFLAQDEAFGNVLAEAMAHGLAVISTPTGLALDCIRGDVNGILVDTDAPEQVAEALAQLIGDAPRRERLGRHAWETARERFDPEMILGALVDLYTELIEGTRPDADRVRRVA